jgi:hypothetical protein
VTIESRRRVDFRKRLLAHQHEAAKMSMIGAPSS